MGCGVVVSSDKRRASKRNAGNCMSAPGETTYAVDKNGCSHDDPLSFQKEEDKKYGTMKRLTGVVILIRTYQIVV